MKPYLLMGLGTCLVASTSAWAQPSPYAPSPTLQFPPTYRFVVPALPSVAAAEGLQAVAGKADVWTLKRGRYDAKELMQALAAKTGGKAIFVDGFKSPSLDIVPALQGTAPELLAKMADLGVAAGKLGSDWVFVPVQPKPSLPSQLFLQSRRDAIQILPRILPGSPQLYVRPALPIDPDFNKRSNPGQNLPPGATPFDFNGQRLYVTPLGPKAR